MAQCGLVCCERKNSRKAGWLIESLNNTKHTGTSRGLQINILLKARKTLNSPGNSGLCSVRSWKAPRVETLHSLGSLIHCLTALMGKKLFLIYSQNLSWFNLCLLFFILPPQTFRSFISSEERMNMYVPSQVIRTNIWSSFPSFILASQWVSEHAWILRFYLGIAL